jgi:hypothetical protein
MRMVQQRRFLVKLTIFSFILTLFLFFCVLPTSIKTVIIPFGDDASIKGTVIDSSVNRFAGIPFALPPTGELRWKKPLKLPSEHFQRSNEPYDATDFKDRCLQPHKSPHLGQQHAVLPPIILPFPSVYRTNGSTQRIACI